ncbi:lytic murein transglycosylase [Candidatus Kaiserbacteria bacterium]|nr:MAG: lytic murein transglycosylase [Candidatus Kaiserbacteria bacterium]
MLIIRTSIAFLFLLALFFIAAVSIVYAETGEEREARLRAELAQIVAEIEQQQGLLDVKSGERQSLERDVSILEAQIAKAQLAIRQRNLTIEQIGSDVNDRAKAIIALDEKILREKASLSQLIRKTNEIDELSFPEMILGNDDLSTIFSDLDSFEVVKVSLSNSFELIADTRAAIQNQKIVLENKQIEEQELRYIQELEKNQVEARKGQKTEILTVTKGEEELYQRLIKEKEQTAAEIRTALFSLRDTGAIPFGDAYDFAKEASAKTGVRPALILGILKQETNLGENVGQCLLTNSPDKGDGKGKNTGRLFDGVMKGSRDVDPFLEIVGELGLDPYGQVVSCPPSYGYGGAMGPAQFIPSTWMLYKDRLGKVTGENPPNPWNPRTAIFATALLMSDNGADKGTRAAERLAALRYFAGWKNANKAAYSFYGDGVMELTDAMQRQIDILER